MAYKDFKDYIQRNYDWLLQEAISSFIKMNHDGQGFHSLNVLSLLKEEVRNVEVKTMSCHDDIGPRIKIDVHTAADIVSKGLGTSSYDAIQKKRWFTVRLRAVLRDDLTDVEVMDVDEYSPGQFDKESALDMYLLPYIYKADLEDQADDFTLFYCEDAIYDGYKLPVEHILQAMDIECYTADLPEDCFGRMYFKKSTATVYEIFPYAGEVREENKEINPGTILLSRQKFFLGRYGTHRLTFAHEIVHWYLHQKYFRLLALLDKDAEQMSCEVEPTHYDENMTLFQKAHWFAEWQANALAIRIAMPQGLVVRACKEALEVERPYRYTSTRVEDIVSQVAELFDVPKYAAKQRLRQLDWDLVDGAFVYVDGKYCPSFSFTEGILDLHQSFVIDRSGYQKLYESNNDFAALIDSGEYIYLGYVVCRTDPKYIVADFKAGAASLQLSDYAREHADECCLIFDWSSTSQLKDEYEFYGQAYLSQEVSAAHSLEYTYDKDFNNKYKQPISEIREEVAKYGAALDEEKKIRIEMMQKDCDTFADALIYHMDRKNITVEDLMERSGLSDTTIKNYRAGKKNPPIENVMAVCIGLNLSRTLSIDLLGKASYHLGTDTKRDRAYNFCLDYTDGTIIQWNKILDAFEVPHIPNTRNQKQN